MHPEYGVLMAPHLNAQIHQHFFQVRLDMTCDDDDGGKGLVVSEVCFVSRALSDTSGLVSQEVAACFEASACSTLLWHI